jgi:hypothetical protein
MLGELMRVGGEGGWYYQGKEFQACGVESRDDGTRYGDRGRVGATQEMQTAVHAGQRQSRQRQRFEPTPLHSYAVACRRLS